MTDLTKLRAELREAVKAPSWRMKEWGWDVPADELRALLDALDAAERERDEARALLDKAPVVSMFYTNHGLDAVSFTDAYHSWKDEVREWKDRTP